MKYDFLFVSILVSTMREHFKKFESALGNFDFFVCTDHYYKNRRNFV